jgi:hypothetical protein
MKRTLTILAGLLVAASAAAQGDFPAKVAQTSRSLLGIKYKEGPLGEGTDGVFDSDPLFSFDLVDCVTFVEETLAKARAQDDAGFLPELLKIRYKDGQVAYESRNHFTEADWLPHNIQAGFLRDITDEVAGTDARTATKRVSKKAWYAAKSEKDLKGPRVAGLNAGEKTALVAKWRALGANLPDETASLRYLPIEKLPEHADRIPSGTVVALVRGENSKSPTMVSHMGLVVRVDGKAYFRHASFNDKVIDVPLVDYFRKYEGSAWALRGLNLSLPLGP